MGLKRVIANYKEFWNIAGIGEIARRYFAMNSFDDVLMVLGILLAGFFGNILEKGVIITAVIGATIAAIISGFLGTYLTETAERESQIKRLEKKVSIRLRKSPIGKAHRFAIFVLAVGNSGEDLLISLLILIPFFIKTLVIQQAYLFSIIAAFVILFLIGVFLGKISKENLFKTGVKMIITGVICAILIFLVDKLIK
jgi:predicted membrane protein (TIGR00267 family)